jgi:hypothetical protein
MNPTTSFVPGSSTRSKWSHEGPEGIELRKDIEEGSRNGTLNLAAPDYMAMYNKKLSTYGKVSKGCFRGHLRTYIRDFALTTTKKPFTSTSGGIAQGKQCIFVVDSIALQLTTRFLFY